MAAGIFASSPAVAASLTWTGSSDGNWFNVGNWSPNQLPTSADDVTIDASVSVLIAGGTPAAFNSLTLGDASRNFSPTLAVSGAVSTAGSMIIEPGATLVQQTTQSSSIGQVTVAPGGLITHSANGAAKSNVVNLSVSGDFNLQAGASITVDGLGYSGGTNNRSGSGPGAGQFTNASGGGGAHGGNGGIASNAPGGTAYDDVTNPTDLGSGGGGGYYGAPGGNGGGAVLLSVGGTLTINGNVSANGGAGGSAPNQGNGAGGGAGGTINLTAATLAGTGSLAASGGSGAAGYPDGGGAGGRISITATAGSTYSGNATAANGAGSQNGGAGTVAVQNPGTSTYSLVVGAPSTVAGAYTPIAASPTFAGITLDNSNVAFDTTTAFGSNSISVLGAVNASVGTLNFNANSTLEIKSSGTLNLTAQSLSGGALQVDGGGTFRQMNTSPLGFASVLVSAGGLITHAANSASRAYVVNLNTTGDFNIQSGASIVVDALGYAGGTNNRSGNGPGAGQFNNASGGGGGHGAGGGASNSAAGGSAYDSITSPSDLGSGGGGAYYGAAGGNGGGAVLLSVGGALTINGTISANAGAGLAAPNQGNGAGGGAGGAVNLTAVTITGAGTVSANGGTGAAGYSDGGGAGGRIVLAASAGYSYSGSMSAVSGTGGQSGGAGTVAVQPSAASSYSLTVGGPSVVAGVNTPVPATPMFGAITLDNSSVAFDTTTAFSANSITVFGSVNATAGILNFSPASTLEIKSGGALNLAAQSASGAALNVDGGGLFRQMNASALSFTSVLVGPGGSITHAANSAARSAVVNFNVAGDFNLLAGSSITADGLGYAGGTNNQNGAGPGAGVFTGGNGSGGGHGGAGGAANGSAGGAAYDSSTNPMDLGSGGGGAYYGAPGGNGGGAILLNVGGNMYMYGAISANGAPGGSAPNQGNGAGGGAGGTVNITASSFTGSGFVVAGGGSGGSSGVSGGGGGGIAALSGCNVNALSISAPGGSAANPGGAGITTRVAPSNCPAPPLVPSGLALLSVGESALGDTTMTVAWSTVPTATSYTLQFSTDPLFVASAASTTTAVSPITLAVLPSTTYYLRVQATNAFGSSAYTAAIATRTPTDLTPPQPPTLVSVTNEAAGVIVFDWQASTSGEATASFNLYRQLTNPSLAGLQGPPILRTSSTWFSYVPPDNQYYFYVVTALDPSGNESKISNPYSVTGAITDNSDYLIVPAGFSYTKSGTHSYAVSVQIDGYVEVKEQLWDAVHGLFVPGPGYVELSAPTVAITGTINADGLGYGYGPLSGLFGPGLGYSTNPGEYDSHGGGGGATYGGLGGKGGILNGTPEAFSIPGTAYGSITQPMDVGSAGGSGESTAFTGGLGGGRIKITGNNVRVDGTLSVNGMGGIQDSKRYPVSAGGGGSGGSIYIVAGVITGSGTLVANGGGSTSTDRLGGGGGGGRIAITYTSSTFSGTAYAFGGGGFQPGAGGTVLLGTNLYLNDTVRASLTTTVPATPILPGNYTFGSVFIGSATDVEVGSATINAGSVFIHGPAEIFNYAGSLTAGQIEVQTSGSFHYFGSPLTATSIAIDSTAVMSVASPVQAAQMIVHAGGVFAQDPQSTNFNLNISGTLTVESGGQISADGMGWPGTQGPGAGYTTTPGQYDSQGGGGGGGYAGLGGVGGYAGAPARDHSISGVVYGSIAQPIDLGSGGGSTNGLVGGAGGGRLLITASTLQLDGQISANGQNGAIGATGQVTGSSGGGSGGTVVLSVTNLHGAGVLAANGGAALGAGRIGGGGGGGRVILTDVSSDFTGAITAQGGAGGQAGGAGTVVNQSDLMIGNSVAGASSTIPSGTYTFANVIFASGAIVELTPMTVLNANALFVGMSTFNFYTGTLNAPQVEFQSGSFVRFSGGALTTSNLAVDAAGMFLLNTILKLPQMTVHSGGLVTHDPNSFAFNLSVANTLTVESGGRISADGKGFDQGQGPGGGYSVSAGIYDSQGGAGGGAYGGLGGVGAYAGAPVRDHSSSGAIYGSITQPEELGSGGGTGNGNAGGRGGGKLEISAGTLQLDGQISANGLNGSDSPPSSNFHVGGGGGSGGAVLISAGSLQGAGSITANGGASVSTDRIGGGGGGGRIALYYNTKSGSWTDSANGGAGGQVGGPGTILDNAQLTGFNANASSGTVAASQMTQKLNSTQSLSETIGAQLLDFSGGLSTGTAPGTLTSAQMRVVLVKTGTFANDGFFRGNWTLALSAATSLVGEWEGMAYLAPDAPRRLILKGVVKGQIRGTLDGTLVESAPGSGVFDRLSADCRVVEIDAATGTGDTYFTASGALKDNTQYPGTSLSVLQTSLAGQTAGYYTSPLNVTFTFLHVNSPGSPYQGEGFFVTTYVAPTGSGSGWAYGIANNQAARLGGILDVPLRGLMEGALTLGNPQSLLLTLQNLDFGLPFNPALTVLVTGPDYIYFGGVATYAITVRNDGYASADGVTVVAITPNYTNLVSASSNYIRYNVTSYSGTTYTPRPFLRWDYSHVPARGSVQMFYQSLMLLPGPGAPGQGSALNSDVQLVTKDYADKVFAFYPPGGTQ